MVFGSYKLAPSDRQMCHCRSTANGVSRPSQAEHRHRLINPLRDQVRSAGGTEAPDLPGRGLEGAEDFLSLCPSEPLTRDRGDTREGRGVSLPAGLTMAVGRALRGGVHLVRPDHSRRRSSPDGKPEKDGLVPADVGSCFGQTRFETSGSLLGCLGNRLLVVFRVGRRRADFKKVRTKSPLQSASDNPRVPRPREKSDELVDATVCGGLAGCAQALVAVASKAGPASSIRRSISIDGVLNSARKATLYKVLHARQSVRGRPSHEPMTDVHRPATRRPDRRRIANASMRVRFGSLWNSVQ
jgi:hypothetical protein